MDLNDDLNTAVFSEFLDGFSPHSSLTSKGSLILHSFTFQSTNSINYSRMNACPITLGHKAGGSMLAETTCIEEIEKFMNPSAPLKVFSIKHGKCTSVVLLCSFVSMDQIEKRQFSLFPDGNRS